MLRLTDANAVIAGALAKGRELNCRPLTVAVLDDAGTLKAFAAEDGPRALLKPDIAQGKGWAALALGMPSRALEERFKDWPNFLNAMLASAGGKMMPIPGGLPLYDESGQLVGAVGVSGDSADNDETCATAGGAAAGLRVAPKG